MYRKFFVSRYVVRGPLKFKIQLWLLRLPQALMTKLYSLLRGSSMNKYCACFAMLLMMGSAVTVCDAQKEYSISSYEVHLGVQRSSAYHVRERIGFNFQSGSFSSAHRSIPLEDIDTLRNIPVSSSKDGPRAVSQPGK